MTIKAVIATINFLGTDLEVLLMPDNTFRISVPQVVDITELGLTTFHASRDIKRILGKGLSLTKVVVDTLKAPAVNTLSIPDFEHLISELAFAGNELARKWVRASVGLTITELAHDAHGIKHAALERQAWLKAREQHKKQFHPLLTRWLQADGLENADYGRAINKFKAHIGLPLTFVGDYSQEHLDKLNLAEVRYDCLRNVGMAHEDAITRIR